jgi:hypothetical protein
MNLKNLFLVLAIIFFAIGLASTFMGEHTSSTVAMIDGIAKGCAGVFFILFYIFMLLGKQPLDKTTH